MPDLSSLFLALNKTNPDGLLLLTQTDASLLQLVKVYRRLKLSVPMYNAYFAGTSTFLQQAGESSEGIVVLGFPSRLDTLTDEGRALYREFSEQNGPLASGGPMFASVFEAFRALHLAISSKEDAAAFLRAHQFPGIIGPWRFDIAGFWRGPQLTLSRVQGGQLVSLKSM